ncbi:MAG TPA: copper-containing nitrite reductase [Kiloniellaceae bacterium]|nr:copper-containing nitrite reductase [Kiloniellaceae bacterium]
MKNLLGSTALATALALALALPGAAADPASAPASIVRDPTEVPAPVTRQQPATVKLHLETIERVAELNDGSTYRYWTFNHQVPGPLTRVRVGDTVEVTLTNDEESWMAHNVDFHAVTGPHGGGHATMAMPGETKSFSFKALKPGLYVYHCATPTVAQHIANGMYGMILVEPEGGLPPVDREFYVMQGELYTVEPIGTAGELTEDYEALIEERPSHYVFNGKVGGLTVDKPMQAKVGETVRLYFGVGGPNKTSSFHVIGEIFDRIYDLGGLGAVTEDVQTVTVAPGGAVIADVTFEVPGTYVLVDHALSRVEKGLAAYIEVEGPANPEVFRELPGEQLSLAE